MSFQEYLETIKPQVNKRIGEIASQKLKDPDVIPMLLRGKRIRAGLLLLIFDAASKNSRSRSDVIDMACAIELAHSASLILDDMLDEDHERRGLPTLHIKKGHKKAMLDAIGVLSLPYDIVSPFGEVFVQTLAEVQRGMVSGVVRELFHTPDLPATKLYDIIIGRKTARLFGLSTLWGGVAVRCSDKCCIPGIQDPCPYVEEMIAFSRYGYLSGKAMQVADDIADLKQVIEGKKTDGFGSELLLLRCMNIDRLVKEAFSDLKNLSPSLGKLREIWSTESMNKTLHSILSNRINDARDVIIPIYTTNMEYKETLLSAPGEIAEMMLKE